MPVTRPSQSQFSNGSGSGSVPVLFSLPNVQPAIAAASTVTNTLAGLGKPAAASTADPAWAPPEDEHRFESSPIVVTPTSGGAAPSDSWLTKLSSQLTNITIVVLLLAVIGLTLRNQQQGLGVKGASGEISLSQEETVAASKEPDRSPDQPIERVATLPVPPQETVEASPTLVEQPPQVVVDEPISEGATQEQLAIPLLLPKPMDPPASSTASRESNPSPATASAGPYGAPPSPFSLTSTKGAASTTPATSAKPAPTSATTQRTVPDSVDTETPSLNTRDLLLMRNGQRRADNSATDPGLPKVELMSRRNAPSTGPSRSNGAVMTGQSYPPVARQYEPISMPSAPSRIIQPSAGNVDPAPGRSPQTPYVPLSPVLPNPNPSDGLDSGNP